MNKNSDNFEYDTLYSTWKKN